MPHSITPVFVQLNEHGFKTEYAPVEGTPFEAEQGAALVNSVEWQEGLGRDMFLTGCPVEMCKTVAMRRGWQAAFDAQTLMEVA